MKTITLSAILEDLQAADQVLRRFEQRYWLSSRQFYDLYTHGALDDGEHSEDFAEWAGFYKLKMKREQALEQFRAGNARFDLLITDLINFCYVRQTDNC